jgi:hypothetical protein
VPDFSRQISAISSNAKPIWYRSSTAVRVASSSRAIPTISAAHSRASSVASSGEDPGSACSASPSSS